MFPNRINSNGAPPPYGQDANASTSRQGRSQSNRSREMPRTLNDLPRHREILLRSQNPAARILGQALAELHAQLMNGGISSYDHFDRCNSIREAAEMLNGSLDVEADVMQSLNLDGMTPETNPLTDREYLAVNDDLSVQLRASQQARSAERGRANLQTQWPQAESLRTSQGNLNNAISAIRRSGMSVEQAMRVHTIRHPDDVAALQRAAEAGPLRTSRGNLTNAGRAIRRRGIPVEEAMLVYRIGHPDDVAALWQAAQER